MQKINVLVTQQGGEWSFQAQIDGSETWYSGRTIAEAVGNLIVAHADGFNIQIETITVKP